MPVKNYYTVNGRIIGEKIAGGSRVDYLSDALGNVTGTVDQSANVINTYRYKPYGELLAKTGSGSDPSFGWVGTLGYRKTSRRFSDQYVRARHYGTSQGQWTTRDPVWSEGRDWSYVDCSPVTHTDQRGLFIDIVGSGSHGPELKKCCGQTLHFLGPRMSPILSFLLRSCMETSRFRMDGYSGDTAMYFLSLVMRWCSSKRQIACVWEFTSNQPPKGWPVEKCGNPCETEPGSGREVMWGKGIPDPTKEYSVPKDLCGLVMFSDPDCFDALKAAAKKQGKKCDCHIPLCPLTFNETLQRPCSILYHELMHCEGLGHQGGEPPLPANIKTVRTLDFIYKMSCCMCTILQGRKKCGEECERVWPHVG